MPFSFKPDEQTVVAGSADGFKADLGGGISSGSNVGKSVAFDYDKNVMSGDAKAATEMFSSVLSKRTLALMDRAFKLDLNAGTGLGVSFDAKISTVQVKTTAYVFNIQAGVEAKSSGNITAYTKGYFSFLDITAGVNSKYVYNYNAGYEVMNYSYNLVGNSNNTDLTKEQETFLGLGDFSIGVSSGDIISVSASIGFNPPAMIVFTIFAVQDSWDWFNKKLENVDWCPNPYKDFKGPGCP